MNFAILVIDEHGVAFLIGGNFVLDEMFATKEQNPMATATHASELD